ncbi:hypothetical protein JTE90_022939 [Oedothorax gibbosus]|uniref:tRNA-queuosine alpha-mannosyltransferase n=1 Tax=Oedothorax gibbosus TaxID=931172 RepID=A0AAV6U7D2_9ARAC|nr:hypothetical protein JTE90_022939 [Oedothorax gibbosus]
MPAKKWHWRSITSPFHFSQVIPKEHNFQVLFTSSVLPLAELIALRPDLASLKKIVYFHENQLEYPVREKKSRYFQHGYNEILSCLVADKVLFNTSFNCDSFLNKIKSFFNVVPDHRPKDLDLQIRPKCEVLYFPISFPGLPDSGKTSPEMNKPLHIVWPHRWEHDKDPDTFFSALYQLKDSGETFDLSVIGETFTDVPEIFEEASVKLKENIVNWGFQASKEKYFEVLQSADVVVSTAIHEFFGVSMLEATSLHCYPLCPNRLAYPEIYSEKYLYNTPNQLFKKLRNLCRHPKVARTHKIEVDLSRFSWDTLKTAYRTQLATQ